jgi:pseudaminic acid biosynthesis-associated methylase
VNYKTEQESFWAQQFGDDYVDRNKDFISNVPFLSKVLKTTSNVNSVIEFGCNIGLNLKLFRLLLPKCQLTGVEINQKACEELEKWGGAKVIKDSIFNYEEKIKYDISMVKGVLIHIDPNMLNIVYEKLYKSSKRYILIAEYYSPSPVSIDYRGHNDKLFKRDFAGEMLDKYENLELLDYGFLYHRDKHFFQDDVSWFLLEKRI